MYCKIFLTKNLSRIFSVVPKEEQLDFFRILCKGKISKQIVSSGKFVCPWYRQGHHFQRKYHFKKWNCFTTCLWSFLCELSSVTDGTMSRFCKSKKKNTLLTVSQAFCSVTTNSWGTGFRGSVIKSFQFLPQSGQNHHWSTDILRLTSQHLKLSRPDRIISNPWIF